MKKLFGIFLCLCMLLSVVTVFSACQQPEEPVVPNPGPAVPVPGDVQVSESVVTVDLTDYAMVRPRTMSSICQQQVFDLCNALRNLCGLNLRANNDNEVEPVENGLYEILIGQTQRVETVEAMSEIDGHGWVIRAFNGKLIIAGTTDFLTRNALDYFVANYAVKEQFEGKSITMNEKVLCSGVEMTALVENGAGCYEIVYTDGIDDQKGSEFGSEYAGTGFDYLYDVSSDIRNLLVSKTKISAYTVPMKTDAEEAVEKEILVGVTNRPDGQEVLRQIDANEYAVVMKNGKVIVGGWNSATLGKAYEKFHEMIQDSVCYDENDQACLLIPSNMEIRGTLGAEDKFNFIVDFPRPEFDDVYLVDTEDVGETSMLYVYGGAGVNRENYVAYCQALEDAGFELYMPENVVEGSSFRTYLHPVSGITLQVDHMAYTHAEEQDVDLFVRSIRIIASSTDYVDMPDAEILEADRTWTKRTDPMVTMLKLRYDTGNFGLSSIITLEDGSFIVYDGGGSGETAPADDENTMYEVMVDIHTKVFGRAPDQYNPLHIRGWIITHEHWDHHMVFYNFCQEYGNYKEVRIDRLLYNPASNEETYNCYNPSSTIEDNVLNGNIEKFIRGDSFQIVKVHTGQKFYFANAELQVLYTHEDIHPQELVYFNNSSTIFRIDLGVTDRDKNQVASRDDVVNTESTIWLGDLERVGSKCMRAMYGDTLKADAVQVAHHGYNGVEKELYALIDPEVVLWPTDSANWIGQTKNPNSSNWFYQVDYFVAHELPNVKLIVVSSYYNTTLTFTENGPDYENLWDALGHKEIVTDTGEVGATDGRVIYRP